MLECQGDEPSVVCALALKDDSVFIEQPLGVDVQISGEHMGQKGNIWQMRRQLRRPSTPYGSEGRNEFCHRFEHGIWRRLPDFCLRLDQLPEAVCLIKFKCQLLILLVTAHNAELGATVCALFLL